MALVHAVAMPELPEVEIVCQGLKAAIEGRQLTKVRAMRPDLRLPLPDDFANRLTGRRVLSVRRRAKYLLWDLDDGWSLLGHLGMSGRMQLGRIGDAPPGKHDHVLFETDQGVRITFHDPRRFGLMDLVETNAAGQHRLLRDIGPEPLDDTFCGHSLAVSLRGKTTAIKAALLDQTVVAGIGNIYASESLYYAGIAPTRPALEIRGRKADRLAAAIKDVLTRAIAAGGSTLRDHRQPSGELGYFQHSFAVYDREGEPCPDCCCAKGVERIVQGNRSTFWCPRRQR